MEIYGGRKRQTDENRDRKIERDRVGERNQNNFICGFSNSMYSLKNANTNFNFVHL